MQNTKNWIRRRKSADGSLIWTGISDYYKSRPITKEKVPETGFLDKPHQPKKTLML